MRTPAAFSNHFTPSKVANPRRARRTGTIALLRIELARRPRPRISAGFGWGTHNAAGTRVRGRPPPNRPQGREGPWVHVKCIARPRDARAREGIRQVPSRLAGQAAASGWPWPCANAGPFCTFAPAYLATYSLQVSPWPRRGQASARARARAHA